MKPIESIRKTGGFSPRGLGTVAEGSLGSTGADFFFGGKVKVYQQLRVMALVQEHAVAIREEAILLTDRMLIGLQHILCARKCADQHQEAGLGQMEVGKHGIHNLEVK